MVIHDEEIFFWKDSIYTYLYDTIIPFILSRDDHIEAFLDVTCFLYISEVEIY